MSGRELLLHSNAFMRKHLNSRTIIIDKDIYTLAYNIINNIPINIYNNAEVRTTLVINIINGVLYDYIEKSNSVSQNYQLRELMEWVKTDLHDELLKMYIVYYKKMAVQTSAGVRFWNWICCYKKKPAEVVQELSEVSAKEPVVFSRAQHEFVDVDFSEPGESAHPAGFPIV